MKVNIICCLLACVLGCNVTAGLTRKVFKEKEQVTLTCPHSVEGKVTWSRDSEGRKVDILTADGDGNKKHINDSGKRYNSQADGSLIIVKASVSDSGRYFCNNEAAVELTVIPSATMIHSVEERRNISLKCPHDVGESGVLKWSKDNAEIQQGRIHVSTENQTLTIREAELADTGLYYCDGKPAAYLNVTKGGRSDQGVMTTRTTTTTTRPTTTSTQQSAVTSASVTDPPLENKRDLLLGIGVLVLILLLIIIIYITWRCRSNRRGNNKQGHVYEEIAAAELKVINGTSDQNDVTYATIPDLPQTGNKSGSPYSLIVSPFHAGNNKGVSNQNDPTYATIPDLPLTGNKSGSSQLTDHTYFLLEKPKFTRSNPSQ